MVWDKVELKQDYKWKWIRIKGEKFSIQCVGSLALNGQGHPGDSSGIDSQHIFIFIWRHVIKYGKPILCDIVFQLKSTICHHHVHTAQ